MLRFIAVTAVAALVVVAALVAASHHAIAADSTMAATSLPGQLDQRTSFDVNVRG